jgi:hypothetical protein
MNRKYHTRASKNGFFAYETDVGLVAAAAQMFAHCGSGEKLRSYAAKLARENVSDHDRQLLGAMYAAKRQILIALGSWETKDGQLQLDGAPSYEPNT